MKILCELCGYWICTFSTSSQWGGFRKNMDDLQERQQITQNLLFLHAKLMKRSILVSKLWFTFASSLAKALDVKKVSVYTVG